MRQLVLALIALLLVAPVACAPAASGGTAQVLATTTILADMAKNVAGDRMKVAALAPAGAHVEEYEPKPDDAKRMSEAKLVLVNGLDLDKWIDPLLKNAKSGTPVVTVTDGLPDIEGNPHMWFDLSLAKRYVEKIRDAFISIDAAGKDGYTVRAAAYNDQLTKLDAELKAKVATIPSERRKLVTSHDAFPYFAKAFGFEIVGFVQPQPDKAPSASQLAELVNKVKAANAPAIFCESGVSTQLTETLAREAGVKKIVTDLPTDSLLDPPADTFVGLIRVVVDKIVSALK